MTYGLRIWDAASALIFDSTTAVGGVPLGLFTVSSGTTVSFPALAGFTVQALLVSCPDFDEVEFSAGVSITQTPYPVVTFAAQAFPRTVLLAAY